MMNVAFSRHRMFISLDGVDGAGKSTQIKLLCETLNARGHHVAQFRDPGSTKLGEAVREILLHREDIPLANTAEMLLYMACRAQLVNEQMNPALQLGQTVVCDRFLLANVVYQGAAGGLDVDMLWSVGKCATGGLTPDKTIVLDLDPEIAFTRIQRGQDRLEKRGLDYYRKVRDGFLTEVKKLGSPSCYCVVDASQSIESIHQQILEYVFA